MHRVLFAQVMFEFIVDLCLGGRRYDYKRRSGWVIVSISARMMIVISCDIQQDAFVRLSKAEQ